MSQIKQHLHQEEETLYEELMLFLEGNELLFRRLMKNDEWKPIRHRKRTQEETRDHIIHTTTLTESGCWEWNGSRSRLGYGTMRHNGQTTECHRVSYQVFVGDIPEGLCVRHRCDNRSCSNPEHLELGTHQDNMKDMVSRNRSVKGENIEVSKLKPDDVRVIRDIYDKHIYNNFNPHNREWSLERLSEMFNISTRSCLNVCQRKTWKHIH